MDSFSDIEKFYRYVDKIQPEDFFIYRDSSPRKRLGFLSVVRELNINLKGIKFLDIGPGYGDSLDICFVEGTKSIDFVEFAPFFFTYNRLKGFTSGYRINHLISLGRLEPNKYDLIWVKGSVSADFFITNLLNTQNLWLVHWLDRLERLAYPDCHIVICPHWKTNSHNKRIIEDVQTNRFTKAMLNRGYKVLRSIRNHNHEPAYPITFYKRTSRTPL